MNFLVIGGTGMISGPVVRELRTRGSAVAIFHRGRTKAVGGTPEGVVELVGDRTRVDHRHCWGSDGNSFDSH